MQHAPYTSFKTSRLTATHRRKRQLPARSHLDGATVSGPSSYRKTSLDRRRVASRAVSARAALSITAGTSRPTRSTVRCAGQPVETAVPWSSPGNGDRTTLTNDQINALHRLNRSERWPIGKIERQLGISWRTIEAYPDAPAPRSASRRAAHCGAKASSITSNP